MMPWSCLTFPGAIHNEVQAHLFPGDGLEAAAVLICARTPGPRLRLVVREAVLVPHEACKRREPAAITWPGAYIEKAIATGEKEGLVLIAIHSHPGGFFEFSQIDDESDRALLATIFQAYGDLHGSAIMTPSGAVRARLYGPDMSETPVEAVVVAGHDIRIWWRDGSTLVGPACRPIAFTSGMTAELNKLTAAVIGVSGTGSIIAEQLARLGLGRVILIDFDVVERKNLNRILNATIADAEDARNKAEMFSAAIAGYRGEGVAYAVPVPIGDREAVLAAGQADVLFSCVDTLEARHLVDLIASAFVIPLFDLGVAIPVRQTVSGPAIADVCGRLDYVQPGGASLKDRGVYTAESLQAEYSRQVDPMGHQQAVEAGYVRGMVEEAPAVIALNMRAGAACVNEFIARLFPFRLEPNRLYARTRFSLAACEEEYFAEDSFTRTANPLLARGNVEPLLGLPRLALVTA